MKKNSINKKSVMDKVTTGKALSRKEELFYLTKIAGFTIREANRIIIIAENKNENLIID